MVNAPRSATGRAEEAVEHYDRGLELEPGRLQARINLGTALLALGRQDEAGKTLADALALAREQGDARRVADLEAQLESLTHISGGGRAAPKAAPMRSMRSVQIPPE